jgi:hypothetical protein
MILSTKEIIIIKKEGKGERYFKLRLTMIDSDNNIIEDLSKVVDQYSKEGLRMFDDIVEYFFIPYPIVSYHEDLMRRKLTIINENGDKFVTDLYDEYLKNMAETGVSDYEDQKIIEEVMDKGRRTLKDKIEKYPDKSAQLDKKVLTLHKIKKITK